MIESISQHSTLDDYRLSEDRIDVWHFPLLKPPEQSDSILNEEEKARAQRFYFPRHQRRFTTARATMRLILSRYLNMDAAAIEFNFNKQGKPFINHPSLLEFNLSHSGEIALLAVGKRFPVGIDLEIFSSRPYISIGNTLFSETEIDALKQAPDSMKALTFFHLWAQKEAFIKAGGLGLSYPTTEFSVFSQLAAHQKIHDSLHQKDWQLLGFMPVIACCAALCCELSIKKLRHIKCERLASL